MSLVGNPCQQLLDLGDGLSGVETLGAGLGAVHDGVASVDGEGVSQLVQPGSLLLIPGKEISGIKAKSGTKMYSKVFKVLWSRKGTLF